MKKDVLIHVRGLQMMDPEEEQEPIEIVVPGQYYYRNGSHYLRYEEMMDDTAEPTVNYIKMSAQGVEVRKQGQVNVHMVFEQGKKNMTFILHRLEHFRWGLQQPVWNCRKKRIIFI